MKFPIRIPIAPYVAKLIAEGVIDQAGVDRLWEEARAELEEANRYGLDSPYPDPESALQDVYTL